MSPKSSPSTRLTHDISLDEFEDDDLSEITEITDECGLSLNCNGPDLKVRSALSYDSTHQVVPFEQCGLHQMK